MVRGGRQPIAWLTVDEADNDPGRFLDYVAASLAQATGRSAPAGSRLIPRLHPGNGPSRLSPPCVKPTPALLLILDDYHAIREFAVHDLVAFCLANQPAGVHLVIGTREDPPLPVPRMRALNQVTEIRERSLRFTLEETSAFFEQTMHLGISPASVATLAARTEGWIAGLQLPARPSARHSPRTSL